ncbi:hypothetical protein PATSB16_22980 [Pandoraea thiooxydans]|nr:hypothetical protein PATSB16_22980 [Pandoraea thiooxydans]
MPDCPTKKIGGSDMLDAYFCVTRVDAHQSLYSRHGRPFFQTARFALSRRGRRAPDFP